MMYNTHLSKKIMDALSVDSDLVTESSKNNTALAGLLRDLDPKQTIEQQIVSRLQRCAYKELSRVSVAYDGDRTTLRGTLPSYFLKQLAQEIAKGVPDVDILCNECVVVETLCE